MKKLLCLILTFFVSLGFISCKCTGCKAIELMGAGDRIHDTYTFANTGVKIQKLNDVTYEISGSVEKLEDENVKKEFSIAGDVTHIVAIKLTAIDATVDKKNVNIKVDGIRSYDAEHLNGSDYTFIILEAVAGETVTITVKWNSEVKEKVYVINFVNDLVLK